LTPSLTKPASPFRCFNSSPEIIRLCRPWEAVLDLLPQPQQGAFKEDSERSVDADGNRIACAQPKAARCR
jgi:hypothetical protein